MKQPLMDTDAPFLPEEIMANILKRLPVKSLIRFRCVCKQWKNLIKTPSFIADHLQHSHSQNPLLILQRNNGDRSRRLQVLYYKLRVLQVLPSPAISSRTRIVGASNGLLCLKFYRKFPSVPFLILWNPATREAREVPQPINNINDNFEVGFGFSPRVNDYKIVISSATQFLGDEDIRVEVYSLSTRSWKVIKVGNFGGVEFLNYKPVTVNGAFSWLGCKRGDHDWVIISFDTAMEVFSLISLPASLHFGSRDRFTAYKNKLAILSYGSSVTDLWVMEEGTGTHEERGVWSKMYSINTFRHMVPCCIWLDEIVYLPKYDEDALYLLNLNTRELENFATCGCDCSIPVTSNHVESLVPIGDI